MITYRKIARVGHAVLACSTFMAEPSLWAADVGYVDFDYSPRFQFIDPVTNFPIPYAINPLEPSTFQAAGPETVIGFGFQTNPNGYGFVSGGTLLGNPTYLPANTGNLMRNMYGTGDTGGDRLADPSLKPLIRLDFGRIGIIQQENGLGTPVCCFSASVTTIEGLLFNGMTTPTQYSIFYSEYFEEGQSLIPKQYSISELKSLGRWSQVDLPTLAPNFQRGATTFQISATWNITSVLIGPTSFINGQSLPTNGEWDFFVDSIALGQPITPNVSAAVLSEVLPVPESSQAILFMVGILALTTLRFRNWRMHCMR